jgi:hypothetical protein
MWVRKSTCNRSEKVEVVSTGVSKEFFLDPGTVKASSSEMGDLVRQAAQIGMFTEAPVYLSSPSLENFSPKNLSVLRGWSTRLWSVSHSSLPSDTIPVDPHPTPSYSPPPMFCWSPLLNPLPPLLQQNLLPRHLYPFRPPSLP